MRPDGDLSPSNDPDVPGSPETESARALRRRAQARTGEIAEDPSVLTPDEARRALHELRVHQIELQLQNEELRRAQEELEFSRARYFDLYDLAPVGYFTINEKGVILEANLTAAKLLGVARSALVHQPFSRFVLREDQDTFYLHRQAMLQAGTPQTCEFRVLKTDSAPIWVRLEATRTHDAEGQPVSRAVLSDIGERKFQEQERAKLESQNRQLQKAEGLGRMAGAIAHHFNNSLTAVIGNLELALGDLPPGANPDRLTAASRAAAGAAKVSTLMLTYLGKTVSRRDRLDLAEVCRQSLPLLRAALPKDIIVQAHLPELGPTVMADANQLQNILANLVTNAWEAETELGRGIRLTVKTVPAREIAESHLPVEWSPQENSYACLEVSDTGSGIADGDFEKLFDPFFSSKFIGRGLGLSVVLGIVRSHGGAVTVESERGRGSTFRVYLPVVAGEVARPPATIANPVEAECCGTVLVVEDEEMVRRVCVEALVSLGFTVLAAADGVEAVELFRRHKDQVRCVVCDLLMPRLGGWETLAALRELSPGIPVVLSSGYERAQVMAEEHAEMPQVFLSKPFRLQALRDAIGLALQATKPAGS